MKIAKIGFASVMVALGGVMVAGGAGWLTPARAVAAEAAMAEVFAVDPVHSMVMFRVGHLGVAYVYGRFNNPTGTFNLDFETPSASSMEISVKSENVDTGNEGRDRHLRSGDFFNAKQYPEITFKAASFEKTGAKTMTAKGDLTLHGVTKPVTVEIDFIGEGETRQGYKAGFEAVFTIKRSEFGMEGYLENNAIGDDVTLMVAIEGKRG